MMEAAHKVNTVYVCACARARVIHQFFFTSTEDSDQIPIIPGLSTDSGTLFYVGSIGTQIANELMDSYRSAVSVVSYMNTLV